jgi:hypothetical protein
MTFTIQEVPEWDLSDEEFQMYDITFPDILQEQSQIGGEGSQGQIKVEEAMYGAPPPPAYHQATASSAGMPVMCAETLSYNPASDVFRDVNSPSNMYVYSPADSSYSTSSMESQQQMTPEDFLGYVPHSVPQMHPPHPPYPNTTMNHVVPQTGNMSHVVGQPYEFGYYQNSCHTGKRRLRDEELPPHEYEKRCLRRERNKEAALRCRTRRRERIEALEKETSELEAENAKVETDIFNLRKQVEELKNILKGETCMTNHKIMEFLKSSTFDA